MSLSTFIRWIRLPIAHVWFFGRICLGLSTSVGAIRLPIAHVVLWLDLFESQYIDWLDSPPDCPCVVLWSDLFESQYIGWCDSAPDCSCGSLAGFV